MREARPRPGATRDAEAPQSADAGDGDGGAGTQQEAARAQRAHKRRDAAADGEAAAFNERHAAEVAEFNQLTQNACLGEDGKLDPAAVKDWQREHNVAPDGKVGPKTIAAAGGKSTAPEKGADSDKVDQPQTGKAEEKKKSPVEDVLQWLDLGTVRQVLQQLHVLAAAPAAADKGKTAPADGADSGRDTSGIASQLAIDSFAAAVEGQKNSWDGMGARARSDKLMAFVNAQLTAAGVPAVRGHLDPRAHGNIAGKFHSHDWMMFLNPQIFGKHKLKDDDAPHMAATVYHEARHAEQHFRMAQTIAGQQQNVTAATIADRLDLPTPIATAAIAAKILPTDPAAAFGKRMLDDKAGSGAQHNSEALKEIEAQMKIYEPLRQRYEAAVASKNPDEIEAAHAALLKVKEPVMAAWNAYVKLATEADAFQTEHAVDAALGVAPQ